MNIMNSCVTSLALALTSPAFAFQPSALSARPSVALHNTLRDMASYPDSQKFQSEFEAFDRNGAFSRSPQGGVDGRPEMMYGGEGGPGGTPFATRGNPNDRMYTQDGFDPYSAYGSQFGMSRSDNMRGAGGGGPQHMQGAGGPQGMEYYGAPGMMGGGGGMNGVHNDNTMEGFSYSSRVREQGRAREQQQQQQQQQGHMEYGAGPPPYYEYQGGDTGGGFDPRFAGGPMMGGGMEYEQQGGGYPQQQQGGYPEGPGEFGGFDGGDMDLSRMGP